MSLMKSLPMVARTEVLRRNTPGHLIVKDRTSYAENLHLGREDDIVKIMQVEGAKCIIT
jgi:membrane protein implicated in regulation of membrane protease activity